MKSNWIKVCFEISFIFAIIARAFTLHAYISIPYTMIYFGFIGIWGVMTIIDCIIKIKSISLRKTPYHLLFIMLLYFIFFGVCNIQNLDMHDAIDLLIKSVAMMLFIIISIYWIRKFNISDFCISATYIIMISIMTTSFFVFCRDSNIWLTLSSFWSKVDYLRERNLFGFISNNIAAEYSMSAIILSIYMVRKKKNQKNALAKIVFYSLDLIMFLVIIMNNSRGTLLALFVVILLSVVLFGKKGKSSKIRQTVRMLYFIAFVFIVSVSLYLVLNDMDIKSFFQSINRYHMLDNFEILKNSGRWFLGIGRISGEFFKEKHILYGLQTNYMEMFYMNVFITSGVLGTIIILFVLISIFENIVNYGTVNSQDSDKWVLIVYIYMLFISLFEQYLFDYSYVSSIFFTIFVFEWMIKRKNESLYNDAKEDYQFLNGGVKNESNA